MKLTGYVEPAARLCANAGVRKSMMAFVLVK
jgi:hypothetical protein